MQQSVEDKFQYGPLTERLIAVSADVATVYVLGRGILDTLYLAGRVFQFPVECSYFWATLYLCVLEASGIGAERFSMYYQPNRDYMYM